MRNYEMVLMALKSGETKTMEQLKSEIPDLQVQFMHKYVARAKYLASAEIELMKAGQVIKTARARDADTLRLLNSDKFKTWTPVTKTGGALFRSANTKVKAVKAPAVPKVKAVKAPAVPKVKTPKVKAPAVPKVKAVKAPAAPKVKDTSQSAKVVDMIKAELEATAPKGVKKAAALPRGPNSVPMLEPVKIERVSDVVTPLSDDPLDIPDFLRIKRTKTEE
jgi:hypothetical protein